MASTFPGAIDSFTDPLSNSPLNSPSHSTLHSDINDAVEKVETYMGLVKVIPTSVTSSSGTAATIATNGTVTVSGNSVVNVNGAFTSLYARYRIHFEVYGSGTVNATMRLRASGTDSATGYYISGLYTTFSSTAVNGYAATNATNVSVAQYGNTSAYPHGGSVEIAFPQLAQNTSMAIQILDPYAGQQYQFSCFHIVASSYDGFSLTAASGTMTGSIRVYGYRN